MCNTARLLTDSAATCLRLIVRYIVKRSATAGDIITYMMGCSHTVMCDPAARALALPGIPYGVGDPAYVNSDVLLARRTKYDPTFTLIQAFT